ncbi:hypothetical protein RhiirA1_397322 [Rhizophagus irregularis]|uniref:Uncharacterized protein n=1 Tax=Rhizophagus irregularis TaxID=588596 RepID=A0A2N0RHQ6_9GLOM|nr:hypothetical protein RhiirA1_397322 [Rhizophagus irregularis]
MKAFLIITLLLTTKATESLPLFENNNNLVYYDHEQNRHDPSELFNRCHGKLNFIKRSPLRFVSKERKREDSSEFPVNHDVIKRSPLRFVSKERKREDSMEFPEDVLNHDQEIIEDNDQDVTKRSPLRFVSKERKREDSMEFPEDVLNYDQEIIEDNDQDVTKRSPLRKERKREDSMELPEVEFNYDQEIIEDNDQDVTKRSPLRFVSTEKKCDHSSEYPEDAINHNQDHS